MAPRTAFILAGGVAKGAFEAGALEALTSGGVVASRIIASSSGALNGTLYAAAVRSGRAFEAVSRLGALWIEEASFRRVIRLSARDVLEARALSTSAHVRAILETEVERFAGAPAKSPIALEIVVAPVDGTLGKIGRHTATTFEAVLSFDEHSFDDKAGRERMYESAAASAAFPGLFEPVELPGLGRCFDGGVVNDAPVKLAIDAGAERIFVIAPYPRVVRAAGPLTLPRLIPRLADALIHERLFRDLRDAEQVNDTLAALDEQVASGALTAAARDSFKELLGWRRRVELIEVRPDEDLPGNAFSGFFHRGLRTEYVAAGARAAKAALARITP
jgi:NTE family protein